MSCHRSDNELSRSDRRIAGWIPDGVAVVSGGKYRQGVRSGFEEYLWPIHGFMNDPERNDMRATQGANSNNEVVGT